mgnify:FL=1
MAKGGLGRGLDALLLENAPHQSYVRQEPPQSGDAPAVNPSLPACIEVHDDGSLWIDPALLRPNPRQPRSEFNQKKLEELADSVKSKGVLIPIIIEQAGDKEFYIIAGERRTRAARMAGLEKVPVQLRKYDEQEKLEVALIENIQRADLNPIEEATAYYNLIQMGDLSQDEVAERVGKNRSTVANALRLLKLPEDIQKSVASGQLSSGHARALLMVKNDADMRILFGKILGSGLSVREAEQLADSYNSGGRASSKKKEKKAVRKDPDVANFEQEVRNLLGVRSVSLKGDMEKGMLQIEYASRRDFERIYEFLMRK